MSWALLARFLGVLALVLERLLDLVNDVRIGLAADAGGERRRERFVVAVDAVAEDVIEGVVPQALDLERALVVRRVLVDLGFQRCERAS